jgi:hypothetical protein
MAVLTPQSPDDDGSCDAGNLGLFSDQSFHRLFDLTVELSSNPLVSTCFNASPARFTTHLSLIVELREMVFVTAYTI